MSSPLEILQIAPRLPWPLSDGGAIGVYNITRFVAARGHRITFVTFGSREGEKREDERTSDPSVIPSSGGGRRPTTRIEGRPDGLEAGDMRNFCRLELVPHDTRNTPWKVLKNLLSPLPYPVSKYLCDAMYARLDALCKERRFDVVHVDHAQMSAYGAYVQETYDIPYVLREHNFETTIYRRYAEQSRLPLVRSYFALQAARLLRYESQAVRLPDVVAAITAEDAVEIGNAIWRKDEKTSSPPLASRPFDLSPARITVIPAGVDTAAARPFDVPPEAAHVVIVGPLNWTPNADAALWFADEIWPRIKSAVPEARCTIAGAYPTKRLLARADEDLRVPGFVEDYAALLSSATVLAVPLRIGGGMRVKLLEFFAHGKAVVSTYVGAEGNEARDGEEILLADGAEAFAETVVRVLRKPDLVTSLGARARELAERRYSWTEIAGLFEDAYVLAIQEKTIRLRRTTKH